MLIQRVGLAGEFSVGPFASSEMFISKTADSTGVRAEMERKAALSTSPFHVSLLYLCSLTFMFMLVKKSVVNCILKCVL